MKRHISILNSQEVTLSRNGNGTICSDFAGRNTTPSADTGSGFIPHDIIDW
jgi:hypothetical protein